MKEEIKFTTIHPVEISLSSCAHPAPQQVLALLPLDHISTLLSRVPAISPSHRNNCDGPSQVSLLPPLNVLHTAQQKNSPHTQAPWVLPASKPTVDLTGDTQKRHTADGEGMGAISNFHRANHPPHQQPSFLCHTLACLILSFLKVATSPVVFCIWLVLLHTEIHLCDSHSSDA
jgi:hypothetical protein